jgi:DNA-binding NarL/FixJ family response regulator
VETTSEWLDPRAARVLVLVSPDQVPGAWAERGVPLILLPLLPDEAKQLLGGTPVAPAADRWELSMIQLVASGTSIERIARELCVAPRTVYRRLARLRRRYGVATTDELRAALLSSGF